MRLKALLIALVGCLVVATSAFGGSTTSGSATLGYTRYEAQGDGGVDVEASAFTQTYSVLRSMDGLLSNGRMGGYQLSLGGEWNQGHLDQNGRSDTLETFKILYSGSLTVAPGGLPFRVTAYSRDRHASAWVSDTTLQSVEGGGGSQGSGPILDPGVATDIMNGQHIETGVQLLVGIRNGSYRGRYRTALSKFPRLLADYREVMVRNLNSRLPQKYRSRDLAFISLNKKNNWAHYRFKDYTDYLDAENNHNVKSVMLGTVDHELKRHWINLTNWIRVAADVTYLERTKGRDGEDVTESYELNLFARARRAKWQFSNLNTFQRSMYQGRVSRELGVPILIDGEIDRDTGYRFRLQGGSSDIGESEERTAQRIDTLVASVRVETFRQRRFNLAADLSLDLKQGSAGKGLSTGAGFEVKSNRRFDPKYELLGAYHVSHFGGTTAGGADVGFWEHEARASVRTELTSALSVRAEQGLVYGTGNMDSSVTATVRASSSDGLSRSSKADTQTSLSGDTFKSNTAVTLDHITSARLRNSFTAAFEYLSRGETQTQTTLSHTLVYRARKWKVKLVNDAAFGSGMKSLGGEGNSLVRRTLTHELDMGYSPGRAWQADFSARYEKNIADNGTLSSLNVEQEYRYSFYTINGIVRRLAQIEESLRYIKTVDALGGRRYGVFFLGGSYYPTKQTRLGSTFEYKIGSSDSDYDTVILGLTAGVTFQKLSADIDYKYGTRSIDSDGVDTGKRDEQRLEINLKKTF